MTKNFIWSIVEVIGWIFDVFVNWWEFTNADDKERERGCFWSIVCLIALMLFFGGVWWFGF
jgi:hypothetical protein